MNHFWIALLRVGPGLHHFQNEKIVFPHHAGICYAAFQIGKTLANQWRCHVKGWNGREAKSLELVEAVAMTVADFHHRGREMRSRDGDDAFARRAQRGEAVIAFADNAGKPRWLEVQHHVPRHGHHVGTALLGRR